MESEGGVGPYRTDDPAINSAFEDMYEKHKNKSHPGIYRDYSHLPSFIMHGNWACGFQSIELLRKWFRGYLRRLKKHGFKVVQYQVPKDKIFIARSQKQLIFFK